METPRSGPESSDPNNPKDTETESPSFWKALGEGLMNTAVLAGQGIKTAYQAGDENKHFIMPAINGIVGHRLARFEHPSAIRMSFRLQEQDRTVDDIVQDLKPNSVVLVFVHGLMADEIPWQTAMPEKQGYGPVLESRTEARCLYIRYNTGRHISENGQDLDRLLSELVKKGGHRIGRMILVGHSMGGLVVRSAGHYGQKRKGKWIGHLSDVVLLGVPNDGSFLERFGHIATFVLKNVWNYPTQIVGRIADERSDGIKDLRWGFMAEDWKREDADKLMNVKRTEVLPVPGVRYHLLLGSMSESVISPLATYFGDGLVGTRSALGKEFVEFTEQAEKRGNHKSLLGRIFSAKKPATIQYQAFMTTGHLGLLGSPEVCQYLIALVAGRK